jgi:chorismate mutase
MSPDPKLTLDLKAPFKGQSPILISGPCSAESEEQLRRTVEAILAGSHQITAIRAGVWKPRTRPGNFEGIGSPALEWLANIQKDLGVRVMTEVGTARHVEEALKAGISMLWIGARTTVNPFYVQEISEAFRGTDISVLVKNPIHPDLGLWIGAMERINAVGVGALAAVHRGFYSSDTETYRNDPKWELALDLRHRVPDLPIICDPSHIAGRKEYILETCQTAYDLDMDGLMIESHYDPSKALSDAEQQLTPEELEKLLSKLIRRESKLQDPEKFVLLDKMRTRIDAIDHELLSVILERMKMVDDIGWLKKDSNLTIFQIERWYEIISSRGTRSEEMGIDPKMADEIFRILHKYSIQRQTRIMHDKED